MSPVESVAEQRARIEPIEARRRAAQRLGDWSAVVDCFREESAVCPDLLLPRLGLAWHQARFEDSAESDAVLDTCLGAAVGNDEVDHRLVDQLLRNIQQSADIARRPERLKSLLGIIESAPPSAMSEHFQSINRARVLLAIGDRGRFLEAVEHPALTRQPGPGDGALAVGLQVVADRWSDPAYPDFRATKVFVIGLSRTGTSSMDAALGRLGFSHLHWINDLTLDLIRPADLFLFDAFSDIGIAADFEGLAHRFPNARFVMTTRPLESWEVSVRRHFARNARVVQPSELIGTPLARTFGGMKGWIESSVYGHYDSWEAAYQAHHARVEEFFSGSRADRLLRFDATAGDGWTSLCSFLDRPIPDVAYPHTNHGKPAGPSPAEPANGERTAT